MAIAPVAGSIAFLAIITVTVIIGYAADVAIVPVAGSIASWLFLR